MSCESESGAVAIASGSSESRADEEGIHELKVGVGALVGGSMVGSDDDSIDSKEEEKEARMKPRVCEECGEILAASKRIGRHRVESRTHREWLYQEILRLCREGKKVSSELDTQMINYNAYRARIRQKRAEMSGVKHIRSSSSEEMKRLQTLTLKELRQFSQMSVKRWIRIRGLFRSMSTCLPSTRTDLVLFETACQHLVNAHLLLPDFLPKESLSFVQYWKKFRELQLEWCSFMQSLDTLSFSPSTSPKKHVAPEFESKMESTSLSDPVTHPKTTKRERRRKIDRVHTSPPVKRVRPSLSSFSSSGNGETDLPTS